MVGKISQDKLRHVAGAFPTGIAVVTLYDDKSEIIGMTINSFLSVSLDPALVMFSAALDCRILEYCSLGSELSISILSDSQKDLSDHFAGINPSNDGIIFHEEDGHALLKDPKAWYKTKIHEIVHAGDHDLVICEVLDCSRENELNPIVFHSGYRKIGELIE